MGLRRSASIGIWRGVLSAKSQVGRHRGCLPRRLRWLPAELCRYYFFSLCLFNRRAQAKKRPLEKKKADHGRAEQQPALFAQLPRPAFRGELRLRFRHPAYAGRPPSLDGVSGNGKTSPKPPPWPRRQEGRLWKSAFSDSAHWTATLVPVRWSTHGARHSDRCTVPARVMGIHCTYHFKGRSRRGRSGRNLQHIGFPTTLAEIVPGRDSTPRA